MTEHTEQQEYNLRNLIAACRDDTLAVRAMQSLRALAVPDGAPAAAHVTGSRLPARSPAESDADGGSNGHSIVPFRLRADSSWDDLLDFVSLVELGCLTGFVMASPPDTYVDEMLPLLTQESFRQYYELREPKLLLPVLHRHRLAHRYPSGKREVVWLYERFLQVHYASQDHGHRDLNNLDTLTFLRVLRHGQVDDLTFESMLCLLGSADELADHLTVRTEDRTATEWALHGFLRFIDCCRRMSAVLEDAESYPIIQSAFWHYYRRWWRYPGVDVPGRIQRLVEAFTAWQVSTATDLADRREQTRLVSELKVTVDDVLSDKYQPALAAEVARLPDIEPAVRLRLLVVDNDRIVLRQFKQLLERHGYDVQTASSPARAKRALAEDAINVVIVDVRLQDDESDADESGLELARELPSNLPKIVFTGNADIELVHQQLIGSGERQLAAHVVSKLDGGKGLLEALKDVQTAA